MRRYDIVPWYPDGGTKLVEADDGELCYAADVLAEIERLREENARLTQENAELRDARKFVRKVIDRIQRGDQ